MKKTQKNTILTKVVVATAIAIFSLASAFTGTYAWFSSTSRVTVSGGSFTVQTPTGVDYDLYYLHHFYIDAETNKDGNYCYSSGSFAGYELAYSGPIFNQVHYDEEGNVTDLVNPTSINNLWPAHMLTYAIVITGGNFNNFSLSSWDEQISDSAKVSDIKHVSLSWAINIYGAAYYVDIGQADNVLIDIATAFSDYDDDLFDNQNPLPDCFTYSEAGTNDPQGPSIPIITTTNGTDGNNKRLILFFTIEFSNDASTFYLLGETYYTQNNSGDSNCYKGLQLTDLVFNIS